MTLEEFVTSLEYEQARWLEDWLSQQDYDTDLTDVLEDFVDSFDFLTDKEIDDVS